jgi:hypothetical protein
LLLWLLFTKTSRIIKSTTRINNEPRVELTTTLSAPNLCPKSLILCGQLVFMRHTSAVMAVFTRRTGAIMYGHLFRSLKQRP